ncbi:MAG: type II toxin-antitoxin system prevent-host-death family antitoxin [Planctomycetes bacterium]|nr:type II toxin-antitoxin system prevent-host-death family antitoxin [Planctomycetota bacterium]
MIAVNVADLKNDAEKYLDAVARGETVEVCREGKPVAVLAPVRKRDPDYWKRPIEALRLEGVSLSKLIIEEREESL